MFDHDSINLAGMASTLQIWKGISDSVGAKEFMVRSSRLSLTKKLPCLNSATSI